LSQLQYWMISYEITKMKTS